MSSVKQQLTTQPTFATDSDRWDAVQRRDSRADGVFLYAVKTTGVFCRPACPSRQPRRENIRFFANVEAAQRAGFRPCKRCRPTGIANAARQAATIARVCKLIENSQAVPSLAVLAAEADMSRYHFHRIFKAITGVTPREYATAHRSKRVRQTLTESATVTDAIYAAGFGSNGRFYAGSAKTLGMTPTAFRGGGEGATIRFGVGLCSFGSILVATTVRGICAILLGDDPETLVRDLQDRFPKAELVGSDHQFEQWMAEVIGFVEKPKTEFHLPLDVQGTAFQQRVWQALLEVPFGTTVTYADLARKIGAPKAARAVALACAQNAIAVAIPCHRVIRNDGSISGYRWGVERKQALLEREADV